MFRGGGEEQSARHAPKLHPVGEEGKAGTVRWAGDPKSREIVECSVSARPLLGQVLGPLRARNCTFAGFSHSAPSKPARSGRPAMQLRPRCTRQRLVPGSGALGQHEFAVTIGAFDPALFFGDLEPDPRMPQCASTSVTGDTRGFDDPGFRGFGCHVLRSFLMVRSLVLWLTRSTRVYGRSASWGQEMARQHPAGKNARDGQGGCQSIMGVARVKGGFPVWHD